MVIWDIVKIDLLTATTSLRNRPVHPLRRLTEEERGHGRKHPGLPKPTGRFITQCTEDFPCRKPPRSYPGTLPH